MLCRAINENMYSKVIIKTDEEKQQIIANAKNAVQQNDEESFLKFLYCYVDENDRHIINDELKEEFLIMAVINNSIIIVRDLLNFKYQTEVPYQPLIVTNDVLKRFFNNIDIAMIAPNYNSDFLKETLLCTSTYLPTEILPVINNPFKLSEIIKNECTEIIIEQCFSYAIKKLYDPQVSHEWVEIVKSTCQLLQQICPKDVYEQLMYKYVANYIIQACNEDEFVAQQLSFLLTPIIKKHIKDDNYFGYIKNFLTNVDEKNIPILTGSSLVDLLIEAAIHNSINVVRRLLEYNIKMTDEIFYRYIDILNNSYVKPNYNEPLLKELVILSKELPTEVIDLINESSKQNYIINNDCTVVFIEYYINNVCKKLQYTQTMQEGINAIQAMNQLLKKLYSKDKYEEIIGRSLVPNIFGNNLSSQNLSELVPFLNTLNIKNIYIDDRTVESIGDCIMNLASNNDANHTHLISTLASYINFERYLNDRLTS